MPRRFTKPGGKNTSSLEIEEEEEEEEEEV